MRKRPYLTKEMCIRIVQSPIRVEPQEGDRYRFWGRVAELGDRFLRVVMLSDKRTIIRVFRSLFPTFYARAASNRSNQRDQTFTKLHSDCLKVHGFHRSLQKIRRLILSTEYLIERRGLRLASMDFRQPFGPATGAIIEFRRVTRKTEKVRRDFPESRCVALNG